MERSVSYKNSGVWGVKPPAVGALAPEAKGGEASAPLSQTTYPHAHGLSVFENSYVSTTFKTEAPLRDSRRRLCVTGQCPRCFVWRPAAGAKPQKNDRARKPGDKEEHSADRRSNQPGRHRL